MLYRYLTPGSVKIMSDLVSFFTRFSMIVLVVSVKLCTFVPLLLTEDEKTYYAFPVKWLMTVL